MLSSSALAVIDRIPERHEVWVFPNPTKDGPIREMRKFWFAVLKAASITNLRLHDLRHSFASDGVTQGIPLYTVGKLLGHRQSSTSQRYAHLADDPMRAASERIGAHLAGVMGAGVANGTAVIRSRG
jgi:site-specific recombinase XerD